LRWRAKGVDMALELVPLGRMSLTLGETIRMPDTPSGLRVIVEFPAIEFDGDRLKAKLRGRAAADWLVIGAEGTAQVDIRFTLETIDGAVILVLMNGRTEAATFNAGGPLYMAPRFETGDARYAWLNRVQAVSKGSLAGDRVVNEVFEVR
ncbi:MAG TPA: DUF3237 domain-containing protein, partial [Minicystis sp.]|nr:DUF3237 domain-containing protein [Minicystis sp.]